MKSLLSSIWVLTFALSILSCEIVDDITPIDESSPKTENTGCSTDNPLEDIAWLKEVHQNLVNSDYPTQITMYNYNGQNVFAISDCFQCPDAGAYIYDCSQNKICHIGGIAGNSLCPIVDEFENPIILFKKN